MNLNLHQNVCFSFARVHLSKKYPVMWYSSFCVFVLRVKETAVLLLAEEQFNLVQQQFRKIGYKALQVKVFGMYLCQILPKKNCDIITSEEQTHLFDTEGLPSQRDSGRCLVLYTRHHFYTFVDTQLK